MMARMPLVNIYSSVEPSDSAQADQLLASLSRKVAELLGKPERYVMTCLVPKTRMTFGGTGEPACYVELKSIGKMSPETTRKLSAEICRQVEAALGVPGSRTYIEFANAEGYLWGHNGSTF
jgi:phenylpyruvate tautomerase